MAETETAPASDAPPPQSPPTIAAPASDAPFDPKKSPIDRTHPDLAAISNKDDVYYVWEFHNEDTKTGPHFARTSLHKASSIVKDREMFLLSHPQIKIDWAKGFTAFPNAVLAQYEIDQRVKLANLRNPDRVGAEQMFPDAPNRIFEAGKPE